MLSYSWCMVDTVCATVIFCPLQVLGASGCSEDGTPASNVLKALRACKNAGSGIPDLQLQVSSAATGALS
jgi:hypothetical protein